MAHRNRLNCFVCNRESTPQQMARIDDDNNIDKRIVAIERRQRFMLPVLEVIALTRLCINCNQSIRNELVALENDPNTL